MRDVILVTGGAGFIGSHLCERLLAEEWEVVNLDNFNPHYHPKLKERNIRPVLMHPYYHLVRGDILDHTVLDKIFARFRVTAIVHLAALAGVRTSLEIPLEYVEVDIKGTVNLLEYAKQFKVARFLFGSSSSVYGDSPLPFQETRVDDGPQSPYAAAKRSGEMFCQIYHRLYNLSVGCLRFFTVYGPRQRPDMAIARFTRQIDQGETIQVYGYQTAKRDYTYVDDIVQGIMLALKASYSFEIFNLGNSHMVPLPEVVTTIAAYLGKQALLKMASVQPGESLETCADLEHAGHVLGYRPAVPFQEGIRRYIEWYRAIKCLNHRT